MTHLFHFALSPVQSFIAQARKAQDLYAGSRILSELARAAAKKAKENDIELIFPVNLDCRSFPNRFIGQISGNFDFGVLQEKGRLVEEAVQTAFKTLAEEALDTVRLSPPKGFDDQIKDYFDLNWFFYEIEGAYDAKTYNKTAAMAAALKNVRLLGNQGDEKARTGRKCSLDGTHNALFFGKGSNENYIKSNGAKIVREGAWLDPNEGLSAISLTKRAYKDTGRSFPSTAKVALSHQMNALEGKALNALRTYQKLFSAGFIQACTDLVAAGELQNLEFSMNDPEWRTEFDEQLLYEENLTPNNVPNPRQLEIAKKLQKQLAPKLTHKYYALIAFDGDKMGELLSGARRKDPNGDLAAFQKKVSEQLIEFSNWIYQNLDNQNDQSQNGKMDVVYAGGDDFLGFVNLSDLFGVVKKLREKFKELVSDPLQADVNDEITFSMGIAIAHYKEPLSMVLQTTRDMEKSAKTKGERNAFAIAALKHSGDNHQTYFQWGNQGESSKWVALEALVEAFQNDCSETFARSLEREFYLLSKAGKMENYDLFSTELSRLIGRSLEKTSTIKPNDLKNIVLEFFKREEKKLKKSTVEVANGLEAVNIALFLKRKNKREKQTAKQHGHQD